MTPRNNRKPRAKTSCATDTRFLNIVLSCITSGALLALMVGLVVGDGW